MKKVLFLIIILFSSFLIYDYVSAACFRVKYSNGTTGYSTNPPDDALDVRTVQNSLCTASENAGRIDHNNSNSGRINFNDRVSCGSIGSFNKKIPEITSWIISLVEIAIPVILAIIGAIDFIKGITSGKEDESKKGQQMFLKRIITAIIIFFIVAFGKLVVNVFSSGNVESGNIIDCIDCFISNDCN